MARAGLVTEDLIASMPTAVASTAAEIEKKQRRWVTVMMGVIGMGGEGR